MHIKPLKFDEKYAIQQLNSQHKQGYCSIPAMVAFLRNDYRDLTLEQAVSVINKWIDEYKIDHEHLAVAWNKRLEQKVVVKQSVVDALRRRRDPR